MKKLLILTLVILTVAACSTPAEPTAQIAGEFPAAELLDVGECLEMISNGDFEDVSLEPWEFASENLLAFTSNANNGSQSVSLGASAQLYQDFAIHSGAHTAELLYWFGTQQPAGRLTVTVQDTNGNVLKTLGEYVGAADLELAVFQADLSDYIGQTVRLSFETAAGSDFWIDDVSVQACGPVE